MKKYTILLDSSDISLSVGVGLDDELLKSTSYEAWQEQSEHMIPELNNLLKELNITKDEIKDVMTSIGPGSYTGIRISLTIAKTICTALNIPLYVVSSLQVLKNGENPSICLINARSNRSYFGCYQGEKVLIKDQIMTNDNVIKFVNEHPRYSVCGDLKYLGLNGYKGNICEEMLTLKKDMKPVDNYLSAAPIYMKD